MSTTWNWCFQPNWGKVISEAIISGVPCPCLNTANTALAFFDGYRSEKAFANLIQVSFELHFNDFYVLYGFIENKLYVRWRLFLNDDVWYQRLYLTINIILFVFLTSKNLILIKSIFYCVLFLYCFSYKIFGIHPICLPDGKYLPHCLPILFIKLVKIIVYHSCSPDGKYFLS